MTHTCRICGQPIKLTPSATERAKKFGETPEFYRQLFTAHADCIINERTTLVQKLIQSFHIPSSELIRQPNEKE